MSTDEEPAASPFDATVRLFLERSFNCHQILQRLRYQQPQLDIPRSGERPWRMVLTIQFRNSIYNC